MHNPPSSRNTLTYLAVLVAVAVLSSACIQTVQRTYPGSVESTGVIHIKLTSPAAGVKVAIDQRALVERVHTDSITIESVPAGEVKLHFVGYTPASTLKIEEYMSVEVLAGQVSEIEIAVPKEGEDEYFVKFLAEAAATVVGLAFAAVVVIEIFADDENSDDDPFAPGF